MEKRTVNQGTENHPSKTTAPPSNILLVEDHRISAKVAKTILSELNCHVDIAMDGKMAIEAIEKHHYDLIFMDIGLPGMNGYEVTRRIRSHELSKGTHVPIIALTAHGDSQNQQLCLDVAMNAIVTKPLRKEKAQNVLNEFIPSRRRWSKYDEKKDSANEIFEHEEKIIDFEYAKSLGNNETLIKEILATLVESLSWETKRLQEAYQQENWEVLSAVAHRLKGAASYCGTLRLESACSKLEECIQTGLTSLVDNLYERLLCEIETLQNFVKTHKN